MARLEEQSPSPSPPPTESPRPAYTAANLALDLAPLGVCALVHSAAWARGHTWSVVIVLLLQLAGAAYIFRSLREQMERPQSLASPEPPSFVQSAPAKARRARLPGFALVGAQPLNPFLHPAWHLRSQWERLRISAMAVTLVPVRAVCTLSILIVLWLVLHVLLAGVSKKDRLTRPLSPWRSRCISATVPWFARRMLSFGFGFYSIEERGLEHRTSDPRVAPIVVANHSAFVDPVLMFSRYFASAVGAIDNLRTPIIGTICEAVQTITVDRKDERSRHAVVESIKARTAWATLSDAEKIAAEGPDSANRTWPQVLVFPEGTTTNGRALISFKPGAFVALKPVQPVVIRYDAAAYPAHRFHPSWVPAGPNMGVLLLRLWSEPINHVRIEYLPPMVPTEHELASSDRDAAATTDPNADATSDHRTEAVASFGQRVRSAMAERLGVGCTEHSYLDVLLQDIALAKKRRRVRNDSDKPTTSASGANNGAIRGQMTPRTPATPAGALPILTSSMEVSAIQKVFNCDLETISSHVERFRQMDRSQRGAVDYAQFLEFFEIDPVADAAEGASSSMRHLFELLDEDASGTLDVREFLLGLALVSEIQGDDGSATIRLAFAMFSDDATGGEYVRMANLKRVFRRAFPTLSESEMQETFRDLKSKAPTPRSSGTSAGADDLVSFEEFAAFCHAHPECLGKFKNVLFR